MTIDTVFLCFAEDSERNDGSLERPLFASANLLKVGWLLRWWWWCFVGEC